MKPTEVETGKLYMGPRDGRVGRSRIRRLDRIDTTHPCAIAHFTEMSDPCNKGQAHKMAARNATLKSFAAWCVRRIEK